jgi:hypothetical protein
MTRLLRVLLTLLFLLSGPAMGQYSDFECWSNAANNAVPTKQSALAKPLQTLFGTMLKMEPRCSSFHRIFTMRQGIQEELS